MGVINKADIQLLKDEFIFWSRLGYGCDPVMWEQDGSRHVREPLDENARYHRSMRKYAGIKIHTASLCTGWIGPDAYDYELCDRTLEAVFRDNEDILFIPRIKLNAPIAWCKEYPEELWVYPDGPSGRDEIREMVGSPCHDLYGTSVGAEDVYIARQSLCSKKWKEDASKALIRLLEHIEQGPYADRIIGYHFGYGKAGETHPWSAKGLNGDCGITARRIFLEWAVEKYGSIEALNERWQQEVITPETIHIPLEDDFQENKTNLKSFFYDDAVGSLCVDYAQFMKETTVENIALFSKIIKEKTNKLVGIFHGYIMHCGANFVGHTDLEDILNLDSIDFIAAPKSYYRYEPGEPCTSYCVPMSVNRKKLWIEEIDVRTHLSRIEETAVNRKATGAAETKVMLWREFARSTMTGSGLWWMDLGGGWYDDKEIYDELSKINDVKHHIDQKKSESISEILMVMDEGCMITTAPDYSLHLRCLQNFACEMNLIGAPSDMYRLCDLKDLDLSQYKLIAFMNTFELSQNEWIQIERRIKPGTTIIWNYAAGIRSPEFSTRNIEAITGFKVSECFKESKNSFPYLEILQEEDVILDYKDMITFESDDMPELIDLPKQGTAIARKTRENGGKSIYAALPVLDSHMLRTIAMDAGVHMMAPLGCCIYGDDRFLGVFSREQIEGELLFDERTDLYDVLEDRAYDDISSLQISMKAKEAKIFIRRKLK